MNGYKYRNMKFRMVTIVAVIFVLGSCASIPKETIDLSQTLGRDLRELQET